MPEDIQKSLLQLQYEQPTHYDNLTAAADIQELTLIRHLRSLNIPCGDGSPLPKCSWLPVFSTLDTPDPNLATTMVTFALATPLDVRRTVADATRPGMKVDAIYALHEGRHILISVLCDQMMTDDWTTNAELLPSKPGPLGTAVEQAAQPSQALVRHWELAGGDALWELAIDEEQDWIRQYLNQDPGPDRDFRSGLENATE